jgi:general L-amino acid transport system permease protein
MPQWWRDVRFWRWVGQVLVVLPVVLLLFWLWGNLNRNLQQQGIPINFGFLTSQAGFAIRESLIPYEPQDSYLWVWLVGLLNTLRMAIVGIGLATIVGVIAGIARLSTNWLVRQLTLIYVEIFRNTPLVLQLLFWYFAVFRIFPPEEQRLDLGTGFFLSNQGVTLPGGGQLSREFVTLLLGLTLYTGAFIAEIVRGSIQAVPKGQWEAAQSLGLKPLHTMHLVIFPQALRVMIPPLTSQYLNLAKNSSLAVAVGYEDIYRIASTTLNQTGQTVVVMLLMLSTYLTISLSIAGSMNLWNAALRKPATQ